MATSPGSKSASRNRLAAVVLLAVVIAVALTACGSSSKPAYCSDVTNFKNAVEQLKNVTSPSALVTQVEKVASTGRTALQAVTSGFAPQMAAVKSSLEALENSVKQLSSSGARVTALAAIPDDAKAVLTAGENLAKDAKSNCG